VLDLRHAKLRLRQGEAHMANGVVVVPRHEIGPADVEAVKRQPSVDSIDLRRGQLADVDAATILRSSVSAPSLSRNSFRFPHFGDWTHDGQPCAHGQPSSIRAVSATHPSNAAKPRSAMPTPPG